VRLTIRLLLQGAFKHREPKLSDTIQSLFATCPALFESILPTSEKLEPDPVEDSPISILPDSSHGHPAARFFLKPSYCEQNLSLPTRTSKLPEWYQTHLRHAYAADYGLPNIYHFGKLHLRWCRQLSFNDMYVLLYGYFHCINSGNFRDREHRVTFNCGDYIQYRTTEDTGVAVNHIGRIDQILVHQLREGQKRLFALITNSDAYKQIN